MRTLLRVVLPFFVVLALSGVAYAYGIQEHTVNGYEHGCSEYFDIGCAGATDKDGDYNKTGRTDAPDSAYLNLEVWDAQYNTFKTRTHCSACSIANVNWDTNPRWECDFKTWHVAVDGSVTELNGHWHWTEAATSASGC